MSKKFYVIVRVRKDVNQISDKPVELIEIVGTRATVRPEEGAAKQDIKVADIHTFLGEVNYNEGVMVPFSQTTQAAVLEAAKEDEQEGPTLFDEAQETPQPAEEKASKKK